MTNPDPSRDADMDAINIDEGHTPLGRWLDRAADGEELVITRHRKPVARLTRLAEPRRTVRFGFLQGRVKIARDFKSPLPNGLLAGFEGG